MAQRKKKSSRLARKVKRRVIKGIIIPLILLMFAYVFVSAVDHFDINVGFDLDLQGYGIFELFSPNDSGKEEETSSVPKPPIVLEGDEVAFHFIDVGQGDAILITTAEGNILVDTSEIGERDLLVKYLAQQNITSLKYLILTHTDADHIGSADYVVENYDVDTVMMTDYEATTKTYERLLTVIENKNTNVIIAESGNVFTLGALQMTVIGPAEKINDPNEMSLVIKAEHGDTSVMLTGDAELKSEAAILKHWSAESLQVDILKVGHHGSRTSTTDEFLAAMNPSVAVISCGEGNDYGHPHEEIVDKLTEKGVAIYRTDKDGTIVIISDGKEWRVVEE